MNYVNVELSTDVFSQMLYVYPECRLLLSAEITHAVKAGSVEKLPVWCVDGLYVLCVELAAKYYLSGFVEQLREFASVLVSRVDTFGARGEGAPVQRYRSTVSNPARF